MSQWPSPVPIRVVQKINGAWLHSLYSFVRQFCSDKGNLHALYAPNWYSLFGGIFQKDGLSSYWTVCAFIDQESTLTKATT